MKVEYISFSTRSERSKYIANKFGNYIKGSLLDVGCDKAELKTLMTETAYVGIDVAGDPDMLIDLEKIEALPFENAQFQTVVCSDVLEHIDNLHQIFGELVRVANRYLIISLPNNWCNARRPIERGKGQISFYGLPTNKPLDRHKWFFGLAEAKTFLEAQQQTLPIRIVETVVNEKPRPAVSRFVRRMRHPIRERYLNRYSHTIWVVYEKIL